MVLGIRAATAATPTFWGWFFCRIKGLQKALSCKSRESTQHFSSSVLLSGKILFFWQETRQSACVTLRTACICPPLARKAFRGWTLGFIFWVRLSCAVSSMVQMESLRVLRRHRGLCSPYPEGGRRPSWSILYFRTRRVVPKTFAAFDCT